MHLSVFALSSAWKLMEIKSDENTHTHTHTRLANFKWTRNRLCVCVLSVSDQQVFFPTNICWQRKRTDPPPRTHPVFAKPVGERLQPAGSLLGWGVGNCSRSKEQHPWSRGTKGQRPWDSVWQRGPSSRVGVHFRGTPTGFISSVAVREVSQALPKRARCSQIQCRLGGVGHGMPARCKPIAYIGLELQVSVEILPSLSFLPSFTSSSSAPSSTGWRVRIDVFCSLLFCCSCDVLGPCTGRLDQALTLHLIVGRQCTLARLGLHCKHLVCHLPV